MSKEKEVDSLMTEFRQQFSRDYKILQDVEPWLREKIGQLLEDEQVKMTGAIVMSKATWVEEGRQSLRAELRKLENIRSGWSGKDSGECCEKCAMRDEHMTGRGDAIKSLVGCRDPFQINCACHLQARVNSVLVLLSPTDEVEKV